MDFGIRELLFVIGVLIFVAVLFDGFRRFLNNRKEQIRVETGRNPSVQVEDDIDWYSGELPSGGARVRGNEEGEDDYHPSLDTNNSTGGYNEPADVLMEGLSANANERIADRDLASVDNSQVAVNLEQKSEEIVLDVGDVESITASVADMQGLMDVQSASENADSVDDEIVEPSIDDVAVASRAIESKTRPAASAQIKNSEKTTKKDQGDLFSSQGDEKDVPDTDALAKDFDDPSLPDEVIAINVIATGNHVIEGAALLEAVSAFGLRYGDMDIFHRHEHASGQGAVVFSMANAVNPGTFDIENVDEMQTKGVTFFMRLAMLNKPIFVLELMLDIAKRLANQLDAELRDDSHSVLSSQTVAHYKNRIQEYERKHLRVNKS